jgi:poly(A) polymerase
MRARHSRTRSVHQTAAQAGGGGPEARADAPARESLENGALFIVRRLQRAGFEACWVGGCVRDRLLGREPRDYDVATSATPADVEALFPRTVPVGRQFGVLLVIVEGHPFQVASFRAEAGYADGRRPTRVSLASARADAQRRDFTVNGLFYDPVSAVLHDWVGGAQDIRARLIRTIGAADARFAEDHLRLLRAVRFAAQLGFEIEPATLEAIQRQAPCLRRISAERVRDELKLLFQPPHAAVGLDLLRRSLVLHEVLPEVEATIACEQSPEFHPEGTVFNHIRLILSLLPADAPPNLAWSALLHDIGKVPTARRDPVSGRIQFHDHARIGAEMAAGVLRRLRFPRRQIQEITTVVAHHMQFLDAPRMRRSTLRRLLARPTFPTELALHRIDCLASHGRLEVHDFLAREARALENERRLPPPLVTGRDLLRLGLRPGPRLGAVLAEIRERQLQETLRTRAAALAWARRQREKEA